MTVYVLTRKGVLHCAVQSEAGLLTLEADNLDGVKGELARFSELHDALAAAKHPCKRCFPRIAE